ncbi:hypothetical protein ABIE44_000920 [Marmoricola sp. OAE513]|uniref:hypothetical protein n=1 Tax=Marmoricola sp. OAE513 TaxID=2817894 RepID=UPI001AE4CBFA
MSKKQIIAAAVAVILAGSVGVLANVLTSNDPASAAKKPSHTKTVDATPTQAADVVLLPGAAGPVKAGMTKAEAIATGLFDADVPSTVDGCEPFPLVWKAPFKGLDVLTTRAGDITSIGVRGAGPTTRSGLGIGSTVADVRAAVKDAKVVETGFGQSAIFEHDETTDGWTGYLFNTPVSDLHDDEQVSFIELTTGAKPEMMRSGC